MIAIINVKQQTAFLIAPAAWAHDVQNRIVILVWPPSPNFPERWM
jgi:hypothetical protein